MKGLIAVTMVGIFATSTLFANSHPDELYLRNSAGGVIVGGLVGYEGGRILKESDMSFYKGAANKALSSDGNGTTTNWKNPETGHSGVFRPLKTIITLNGQTCRHFRSTVAFADTVESGNGTACQQVDGNWKIISNYFG